MKQNIIIQPKLFLWAVSLGLLLWLGDWGLTPTAQAQEFSVPCPLGPAILRSAINQANSNLGPDVINLAAGCTYTFQNGTFDFAGNSALPVITDTLVIRGNGAILERDKSSGVDFRLMVVDERAEVTLEEVTLRNGKVAGNGGGINVNEGNLILNEVYLTENIALGRGGGVFFGGPGNLNVTNSRLEKNEAESGGGIYFSLGNLILKDSLIIANIAQSQGGGIRASKAIVDIGNTHFAENISRNLGGGMFVGGQLNVQSSTFTHNAVKIQSLGGGLFFVPSPLTVNSLVNNVWFGNGARDANGMAIYIHSSQGAEVNLSHNTMADKFREDATSAVYCDCVTASDTINLRNNIIINHGVGVLNDGNGAITTQANLYFNNNTNEQNVTNSSDHLTANPFFRDFSSGDLHLQATSPAIDQGVDLGLTVDRDGNVRPQGQGFDIGAYEFEVAPSEPTPTPEPNPNPDDGFTLYLPLVVK